MTRMKINTPIAFASALLFCAAPALATNPSDGARASALVTPGPTPDKATDAQKNSAKADYLAANKAFASGQLEEAQLKFRASYAAVGSPNSRMMLARVLMKLGRNLEAHREAQAANEEAQAQTAVNPKYTATTESTRDDLKVLEKTLGLVNVALPPGASDGTLTIGGDECDLALVGRWVAVKPGSVKVAYATANGDSETSVNVAAGAKVPVVLPVLVPKKTAAPTVKEVEPPKDEPPIEPPPPAEELADPNDRGALVVGLKAGALVSVNGLQPNATGVVELGYVLPFLRRAFGLIVDVGYAQPATSQGETDPRVAGGGYTWQLVQQQLTIQPSLYYRATMLPSVGPGKFVPYVAAGPRVFLTRSHTDSDGTLPVLLEQTEDSTQVGFGAHLGTEFLLGPGAFVVEGLLGWAPIEQRTTGTAALTAVSAFGGYRFML